MAENFSNNYNKNGLPSLEHAQRSSLLSSLVLSCRCKGKIEKITYQFYTMDKLGLFMYSYQIRTRSSLLSGLVLSCRCKGKIEKITYQFYTMDKLGLFMYSYQIRTLH